MSVTNSQPASSTVIHPASWTDPEWRAEADGWIHDRLADLGMAVTGPIAQPHVEPWSTVLRVPTAQEPVWFKANIATCAHEAGVVELVAQRRPDAVPALLASDAQRGWLLMADGGQRLREIVESERDLGHWLAVLSLYSQLQVDLMADRAGLLAAGAPDRGLAQVPGQFAELLDAADDLSAAERQRLRGLTSWVEDSCAALAAVGIPETVQHDDLHDGQVYVKDGRYLILDWGDSCVAHPFFTMSVTLEGVLAWGLDDIENSLDVGPFRDAYLQPFRALAAQGDLDAGFATALRLGWIGRAFAFHVDREALGRPYPEALREAVGVRLRMFLAGMP